MTQQSSKHSSFSRDERLQQYFDGELPAEERALLEAELQNSEHDHHVLAGLNKLQSLVQWSAEDQAATLDSEALFARIQQTIAADKESHQAAPDVKPGPALRVIRGGRWREKIVQPRLWGGVAALTAVAAALMFVFWPNNNGSEESPHMATRHAGSDAVGSADISPRDRSAARATGQKHAAGHTPVDENGTDNALDSESTLVALHAGDDKDSSDVIEVDFGNHTGTVFAVEDQDGGHVAVVWISET